MKLVCILSLFVISLSINLFSQTLEPIINTRYNNANGVPIDSGKIFKLTGIVTAGNQFGNAGPGAIQDLTAGVSVYGSSFANAVAIGDSVTITGTLSQYSGLTQIDFSKPGGSVVKHSSGNIIEPELVSLAQIKNQLWNGIEEIEGKLVRINNVTISGTGNFASGTNYSITDTSGILTSGLRIDNNVTTIIGSAIPSGQVDIIGIVAQYKYSAPYNSGYQIQPRYISDIVYDSSPIILNPIMAANIDTSSFSVFFNTARNGNAMVKYGLTQDLELDSVVVNEDTTVHQVNLSGLTPSTTYYFKAFSSNEFGTSSSSIQMVTTATQDTSIGKINVYFNFSVDTTIALPDNKANGNVPFENKLIERINSARYSIDLALYSFFGMPYVADAIVLAKNRGVKVRVVYDYRDGNVPQNSMQTLLNAGIKMSRRPNINGIMHNKFFVIDARDTIPSNDWVWTGSWNVTSTELGWKNNVVEINDPALAQAYTKEFEEMWGSTTEDPNSTNAKFGPYKTDNVTHSFNIGGRSVQLYFSPSDQTESKIVQALTTANKSVYVSMYAFTSDNLERTIYNRYQIGANDVRGVIDQQNITGSQYSDLQSYGDLFVAPDPTAHHKYAIIDALYADSYPTVITGSHNWSRAANEDNDENTLIISDSKIANLYLQEFKKRYNEAGGTGIFVIPTSVNENNIAKIDYQLYQNYPNPFNPVTTIKFQIPTSQYVDLSIYNMLGEKVKTLFSGFTQAGIASIDFNAKDLPSGIYIYRIKTDNTSIQKKLVLLK
ncbi:MAG: phospholipase D-like domain-containing protein [Syntrophothermus sp.]